MSPHGEIAVRIQPAAEGGLHSVYVRVLMIRRCDFACADFRGLGYRVGSDLFCNVRLAVLVVGDYLSARSRIRAPINSMRRTSCSHGAPARVTPFPPRVARAPALALSPGFLAAPDFTLARNSKVERLRLRVESVQLELETRIRTHGRTLAVGTRRTWGTSGSAVGKVTMGLLQLQAQGFLSEFEAAECASTAHSSSAKATANLTIARIRKWAGQGCRYLHRQMLNMAAVDPIMSMG
jgi:hypothetical protein